MKRIVVVSVLFLVGFSSLVLSVFAYQVETSIDEVLNTNQQNELFALIDSTDALPNHFHETIERYYPEYFHNSNWSSLIKRFTRNKNSRNPFLDLYIPPFYIKRRTNVDRSWIVSKTESWVIALEIEERYSSKRCYDFLMAITDFGSGMRGVKTASKKIFNKNLNELDQSEILILHLMRNGSYYNPIKNPAVYDLVEKMIQSHP